MSDDKRPSDEFTRLRKRCDELKAKVDTLRKENFKLRQKSNRRRWHLRRVNKQLERYHRLIGVAIAAGDRLGEDAQLNLQGLEIIFGCAEDACTQAVDEAKDTTTPIAIVDNEGVREN